MGTGISSSSRKQELETNQEEKGEHFKARLIHTLQKSWDERFFTIFMPYMYYLTVMMLLFSHKLTDEENKPVLKLQANHHHTGAEVRFSMRVTGVHNDRLDRQVTDKLQRRIFDDSMRGDFLNMGTV